MQIIKDLNNKCNEFFRVLNMLIGRAGVKLKSLDKKVIKIFVQN